MINRSEAPQLSAPAAIQLIEPSEILLNNNAKLYIINGGTQDVSYVACRSVRGSVISGLTWDF